MTKETGTPQIRFSGYNDTWEQRKLLSCIQSITDFRGRTPKKLGMDWSESGYLALSALNVKDGYIDFSQDVHYGNQELYDKWMSGKELHRGQVLFTTEAPMGNVAQVPDNKGYILSQRTIAFDVEEEILSENFLATLLRTPNVFNDLTALSSGGTAKGVSQKSLSGLDVVIPKNIDEQNKLADYFINLDNLITLHQRKYDKLVKVKKSMLEKMFPRKGAKVPEIRFYGFTDDWEQRKLSDVVDSVDTGKSKFNKEGSSGEYPILGSTSVIGYDDEYDYDGDFILTARVGANAGSLYRYAGKVKISDNTVFIQASQNIEFLYQLLIWFDIKKLSFGTGQPLVKASELKSLELIMPTDMKEQMRIGVYFKSLDHLITLHQRKLEKLKNLKKACLKKMFI